MFNEQGPIRAGVSILLVLFYISARLWRLTDACLWFDEIFSVHAAEHAWNELFPFVALDLIHPPFFYLLLKAWIALGGEGLVWLRLLPVFFSVIAIVPFVFLCRELNIKYWLRSLALFLLATNGCLIKYAQEVRMYSLLMCLSLFSMLLFVRFLNRGVGIVALTIVNLLMVYTHYFGWLVVASEVVAIAAFHRKYLRRALSMTAVVAVGVLPWVLVVWKAAAGGSSLGQNIGWMVRPGLVEVGQFLLDLIEPLYYQASSIEPASDYRVSLPLLMIALAGMVFYLKGRRSRPDDEKKAGYLLSIFALVPITVAFIASWLLPYAIWGTRHLIVVFVPAALLIAIAIGSMRQLKIAAATLIVLFACFAFVNVARSPVAAHSWCNWAPLGIYAADQGAEKIFVLEDLVAYHLWFSLRERGTEIMRIRNVGGVNEDAAFFLPRGFDQVKSMDVSDVRETSVWIAYRGDQADGSAQPLKAFVDSGYEIIESVVLPAAHEQTILLRLEKGS